MQNDLELEKNDNGLLFLFLPNYFSFLSKRCKLHILPSYFFLLFQFFHTNTKFKLLVSVLYIQNLRVYVFLYVNRELLAFLEIFEGSRDVHPNDSWTSRNGIIKLQSLLHRQLSAEIFQPMIRYAWYSSGLLTEKKTFLNVRQACFEFSETEKTCLFCNQIRFIKCARCRHCICFSHFYFENHIYTCFQSPSWQV